MMQNPSLYELAVQEASACREDRNHSNNNWDKINSMQYMLDAVIRTELMAAFPDLCGQVRLGISVGPGWIPLIVEACTQIKEQILDKNPGLLIQFVQIKEKFGGLRMYTRAASVDPQTGLPVMTDEFGSPILLPEHELAIALLHTIIEEAENKAAQTCEVCGNAGEHRISLHGYHHTACDAHVVLK